MKIIMLSGGSGKRLWPLSNDYRSKQFLKVIRDPNNQLESMVQRVWRQIKTSGLLECTFITTSQTQKDILMNQIADTPTIIFEPDRRDTFPAIILSCLYLYSIQNVSIDEVITIIPVDPYVDDQFFNRLKDLELLVNKTNADIALIGVQPTFPSEKYGYIVPKGNMNYCENIAYREVNDFVEKPNKIAAEKLIDQDSLWNCGVFSFKLSYILNLLHKEGIEKDYETVMNNYSTLKKISFDYQVVEKASNVVVMPYEGSWKDLGTWNTLTEEMDNEIIGTGIIYGDSHNTHLINELNIPATVIGLSNSIVALSSDGLLVADKNSSYLIKEVLKNETLRPMYEEKSWGWYRIIDYDNQENHSLVKKVYIYSGKNISYQMNSKRSQTWMVIKGKGQAIVDDKLVAVQSSEIIRIPSGTKYSIRAINDLEIIEIQQGDLSSEGEIIYCEEWSEIIKSTGLPFS